MTDLVVVRRPGEIERVTIAAARSAEDAACHSRDPWVRSDGWADRWLASYDGGTKEQYARVWRSLGAFGEVLDVAPVEWVRSDVERWVTVLQKVGDPALIAPKPLADGTVAQRMAAASSFFMYCLEEACNRRDCDCKGAPWVNRNPVPKGKARPKQPTESPQQYLSVEAVIALQMEADAAGPAASALVALLLACLRVSAACNARIEQLGSTGGHNVLRVRDKGGKIRTIPLPPPIFRRVMAVVGDRTEGFILETLYGNAMDRSNAYDLVRQLAERAGIAGRVGPHTLRHAVITRAFERGTPLSEIQDWAGHADPRVTRRYDRARLVLDRSPAYVVVPDYYRDAADVVDDRADEVAEVLTTDR